MQTNYFTTKIIMLVFLLILGSIAHAQKEKVDSLKNILQTAKDTTRVNALNDLSGLMIYENSDTALLLANQAYTEGSGLSHINGIIKATANKSEIHFARTEWDKWEMDLRKLIELTTKHKKSSDVVSNFIYPGKNLEASTYVSLGMSLQGQCKNVEALKSLKKAETLIKGQNDQTLLMGEIYAVTAQLHHTNGDYEKAYEYYTLSSKKALEEKDTAIRRQIVQGTRLNFASFYESIGDHETAAEYYNTVIKNRQRQFWRDERLIARMFFNEKKYDSALILYSSYLVSAAKNYNPSRDSLLNNNRTTILNGFLGNIYNKLGVYNKALEYLLPAYNNCKSGGVYASALDYLQQICQAYIGLQDYSNALIYSKELVQFAEKNGVKIKLRDGFQSLATIYIATSDIQNAYKFLKKYSDLKDSINTDELRNRLRLNKAEERERNKQSSIEQLKKEKRWLTSGIISLAISIASFFGLVWMQRKYNAKKRLLQANEIALKRAEDERRIASLEMMSLRSQMNPHFIFNCLNSINRFVLRNDTESASNYLTKFSKLMRMVLENSKQVLIPLEEEVKCLELYIQMEQFRCKNSFSYYVKYHDGVNTEEAMIPPLLLQPFVENAIWHGVNPKEGDGRIGIEFFQKEEALYCVIKDNGIGRKKASELKSQLSEHHKSMGLQITKERLAILGENDSKESPVEIEDLYDENENASGTKVTIRIFSLPAFEELKPSLNL